MQVLQVKGRVESAMSLLALSACTIPAQASGAPPYATVRGITAAQAQQLWTAVQLDADHVSRTLAGWMFTMPEGVAYRATLASQVCGAA